MNTKTDGSTLDEVRSRLERRANVIRSRLVRSLDALDARRHQVQAIGRDARRLAVPIAASMLGVVALAAGTALAIHGLRGGRVRPPRLGARMAAALAPLRAEPEPSPWRQVFRRVAVAVGSVVFAEIAKRATRMIVASHERSRPAALLGPGRPLVR